MDNNNIKSFNMRYSNIKVSKFSQYDLKESYNKERQPFANFLSNFKFDVTPENNKISCLVSISISLVETSELFCELEVQNDFEIKELNDIKRNDIKGKIDLPIELMRTLISLSISTVRGILSEKMKGTIIQGEIYPLIDPATLFNKKS